MWPRSSKGRSWFASATRRRGRMKEETGAGTGVPDPAHRGDTQNKSRPSTLRRIFCLRTVIDAYFLLPLCVNRVGAQAAALPEFPAYHLRPQILFRAVDMPPPHDDDLVEIQQDLARERGNLDQPVSRAGDPAIDPIDERAHHEVCPAGQELVHVPDEQAVDPEPQVRIAVGRERVRLAG